MIIGECFQRILENDPVARRILIKHQEGHSKHLRNAQKGTLFVVDQHFPDGRLKKGANHKRASSDEDLNNFKDFQPPSLRERDTFAEHAQHDRAFVEKYGDEIYGRSAHLLSAAHNAEPEVGHEASAMSGKSPGRGRPRKQHSANKVPNPPDNRTDEPSSPSPTLAEKEQEVADSQESYVSLHARGGQGCGWKSSATGLSRNLNIANIIDAGKRRCRRNVEAREAQYKGESEAAQS
jgi:hypothetical protein